MLFHEQPTDPWINLDFMLIEAMQILEEETCAECGNPIWICRNDNANNVGFKIKTATCYAKVEFEKWQEKQEGKKDSAKKYGQFPYIEAYTYDDGDMPSRMQFYRDLIQNDVVE
jgi:hypothetical protein